MSATRFVSKSLQGTALTPGKNTKGVEYKRSVSFEPGYEELVNIVAGLQKDIKRINQCLTLEGAVEWAAKRGPNWEAVEGDITGPNGKPDGINEVFVTDSQGRVKVINGVSLEKTSYPKRKAYRTKNNTIESRKAEPYTQFVKNFNAISNDFDGEHNEFLYREPAPEEFAGLRPVITPRNAYKAIVFQPVYDEMKPSLQQRGFPPMILAQIYNKALSTAYNTQIRDPEIEAIEQQDINSLDAKTIKKTMQSTKCKDAIRDRIAGIITEPEAISNNQGVVHSIIEDVANKIIAAAAAEQAPPQQPRVIGAPRLEDMITL